VLFEYVWAKNNLPLGYLDGVSGIRGRVVLGVGVTLEIFFSLTSSQKEGTESLTVPQFKNRRTRVPEFWEGVGIGSR
jgi:hypothetical protein